MRIGILGSGEVARALAAGFLSRGNRVMLGTREAEKLKEWRAGAGDRASVGSFAATAQFGGLVVLATHGMSTVEILKGVGAEAFAGKTVIDATNPLRTGVSGPELAIGFTDSLGEQIQRTIPSAHVVKCFNTVGNALMIDPTFAEGPADMFLAGNDEAAKRVVGAFVTDFGWNVVDLGGIELSRLLEPMCMTWIRYGITSATWNHAFKFVKASS